MVARKIFPNGHPYKKFTKVPTLTPPFLRCDVNADKVDLILKVSKYLKFTNT